ncbi:MAG: CFI-box-CTERM domain-containing protein [Nitrososphaeraceae archaeon]
MNLTIFPVIFLIFFGMADAFAQSSLITFDINETSFAPGEIVDLKGSVDIVLAGKPVAIEVKDSEGNVILIRTVTPDANGDFVLKFKIPESAKAGTFEIVTNIEAEGEAITETKTVGTIEESKEPDESVCGLGTVMKNGKCVPEERSSGGGCLIATATFGSELSSQVQQLRELRDNTLLQTESGSAFMSGFNDLYYSFSPTISDWERQSPVFKEAVKLTITPMITSLSMLNYVDMDSEAEVLAYGISLILLNIGMYIVAPVGVGMIVRRKF